MSDNTRQLPVIVRKLCHQPTIKFISVASDPRAFDFLHPAASRPNYLFGLWDPSRIDEKGRYRRMVVQQATLDGILSWPKAASSLSLESAACQMSELQRESSAVLAGVMLMASGRSIWARAGVDHPGSF